MIRTICEESFMHHWIRLAVSLSFHHTVAYSLGIFRNGIMYGIFWYFVELGLGFTENKLTATDEMLSSYTFMCIHREDCFSVCVHTCINVSMCIGCACKHNMYIMLLHFYAYVYTCIHYIHVCMYTYIPVYRLYNSLYYTCHMCVY